MATLLLRHGLPLAFLLSCAIPTFPIEPSPPTVSTYALTTAWTIRISDQAPIAHERAIRAALAQWEAASPCSLMFTIERANVRSYEAQRGSVENLPEGFAIEVAIGPTPDGDYGFAHWDRAPGTHGAWILLRPDLSPSELAHAARHELGHAFRIEHDNARPGAMAQTGGPVTDHVSESDGTHYGQQWCSAKP